MVRYILCVAASVLQWPRWVAVTARWPRKPKIFAYWPFIKSLCPSSGPLQYLLLCFPSHMEVGPFSWGQALLSVSVGWVHLHPLELFLSHSSMELKPLWAILLACPRQVSSKTWEHCPCLYLSICCLSSRPITSPCGTVLVKTWPAIFFLLSFASGHINILFACAYFSLFI